MTTPIPTASSCFTLQLPPIEKDDRLNLNVRTGAAATLHNSFVFTHGGLTMGLELDHLVTIDNIILTFAQRATGSKSKRLTRYLSGELFSLDLISRCWCRIDIDPASAKPRPRMFHEIATGKNCLYIFGGLVVSDDPSESMLVPTNDLWEFNLLSKTWILLHDGTGWESDPSIPSPRFSHKMTQIRSLVYAQKKDHYGLLIAGGKDCNSQALYSNYTFDMVDKKYVGAGAPLFFPTMSKVHTHQNAKDPTTKYFKGSSDEKHLNVNYLDSVIVSFVSEQGGRRRSLDQLAPAPTDNHGMVESIIIYAPTTEVTAEDTNCNPLLSYRIGKKLGRPRTLPLHKKEEVDRMSLLSDFLKRTIPYNLRYPTGGIFGQNIVIVGFLPNEFDVSIFIFNKPTGKWSRLNIFCSHDYGSHRFWGGFVWSSHHKVVLLGNYVTSRTTSSMRYFSSMITVSLPVMNILTSLELAGGHLPRIKGGNRDMYQGKSPTLESETLTSCEEYLSLSPLDISDDDVKPEPSRKYSTFSTKSDGKKLHNKATFSEYVHYAAPKVKFTNVRSVFPPAAITLGRNAFDRYGDCILDFELVSSNGDRIPVCLPILMERWGKYFVDLLARAYVKAIDQFERDQIQSFLSQTLRMSKGSDISEDALQSCSSMSDSSRETDSAADRIREKYHLQMNAPKTFQKDAPQFRLPFQDKTPSTESLGDYISVDPHNSSPERRSSVGLNLSGSLMLYSHLRHLPAQLPLPTEPIPDVPATPSSYRSSSRSNSIDPLSPRASLLHTLSVLRNIPKSPKGSPFLSPRGSVSVYGDMLSKHKQNWKQREVGDTAGALTPQSRKSSESGSSSTSRLTSLDLEKKVRGLSINDSNKEPEPTNEDEDHSETNASNTLLDFDSTTPENFKLEPSLVPRKLYIPFGTTSIKAFAEFFYTGQVGNKWTLRPCALDCLLMARYFKVPLLYDLICEVLYGIIGRKEALVIKEGHRYKKRFMAIFQKIETPLSSSFKFPLDEFEGFLDTIDDGFLDLALLRKLSNVHKLSHSSATSKTHSPSIGKSFDGSMSSPEKPRSKDRSNTPKSRNSAAGSGLSTDSTSEDNSEEEPAVALHYLDPEERSTIFGQRSKSIFERPSLDLPRKESAYEEDIEGMTESALASTLESLVSPDAPEPSNYVIDLIYETASMCTDVKLMLRSMNARQMGIALEQTKRDYKIFLDAMNMNKDIDELDEEGCETAASRTNTHVREKTTTISPSKKPLGVQSTGSSGILLSISPTTLTVPKEEKIVSSRSLIGSSKSRPVDADKSGPGKPLSMMRLKSEFKMNQSSTNLLRDETMKRSHTDRPKFTHPESVSRESERLESIDGDDDNDDAQLIQTNSSRTSRSRFLGKLRTLTKDSSQGTRIAADLKRSQSSASVLSLPSLKGGSSGKRSFFGLRRK